MSVPHTPQNATSTFTWSRPHEGSSTSRISTLPSPQECFTSAFMVCEILHDSSCDWTVQKRGRRTLSFGCHQEPLGLQGNRTPFAVTANAPRRNEELSLI